MVGMPRISCSLRGAEPCIIMLALIIMKLILLNIMHMLLIIMLIMLTIQLMLRIISIVRARFLTIPCI